MLYSLFVMIGDGKGSFWCGTEGEYMSSDSTSRARAGRVRRWRAWAASAVLRHITLYIRDTRETRHTTHAFYALAGCEVDEPMARRRIQRLIGRS